MSSTREQPRARGILQPYPRSIRADDPRFRRRHAAKRIFITNLGHRLYSEDFLQILNETFGPDDTVDQANPGRIEYFLRQTLDYPVPWSVDDDSGDILF